MIHAIKGERDAGREQQDRRADLAHALQGARCGTQLGDQGCHHRISLHRVPVPPDARPAAVDGLLVLTGAGGPLAAVRKAQRQGLENGPAALTKELIDLGSKFLKRWLYRGQYTVFVSRLDPSACFAVVLRV